MIFYKANQEYNASLTADYTAGDATLSVNTVPSNFPTIVTVARNTSKETRFTVTGGGAGQLTGVARLDGANENISAGVSVECMYDADFINQLEDAVFTQTQLKNLLYAADGGANDTYAITLAVAPDSYTDITGLPISFKANTVNTGPATLNVNSLGAKTIKKQATEDLADGDIAAGQIVTVVYDGTNFQLQSSAENNLATEDYVDTVAGFFSATKYAPQGFLLNGKIAVSVASNNITVAIKGMDGNDPSASNPVYCRIGDTVRTITAALSVTKNAGTNWFNSGATGLATKEIDYFVYLGYNATDGVTIGFARIPYAKQYGDFSTTTTNDRYCAISTITTAASTDYYELIGRFAATLSATASFNWSIPTFTAATLIQHPIYETRLLSFTPVQTGMSADSGIQGRYKISRDQVTLLYSFSGSTGTSNAIGLTYSLPLTSVNSSGYVALSTGRNFNNSAEGTGGQCAINSNVSVATLYNGQSGAAWTASGGKFWEGQIVYHL